MSSEERKPVWVPVDSEIHIPIKCNPISPDIADHTFLSGISGKTAIPKAVPWRANFSLDNNIVGMYYPPGYHYVTNTTGPEQDDSASTKLTRLEKELESLRESHNNLFDAYKALVVEHREVMDRVDAITRALNGQQAAASGGRAVGGRDHFKPTGYWEEGQ